MLRGAWRADLSAHASCQAYADRAMRVVERLLRLWTEPLPLPAEAVAAFREAYTDPVSVNGVDMSVPLTDTGSVYASLKAATASAGSGNGSVHRRSKRSTTLIARSA